MSQPLVTYLRDHLAGARGAINLLQSLRDQHTGEPLAQFVSELLPEVDADRARLKKILAQFETDSNAFRDTIARLTEKASRWKLSRRVAGDLGAFQSLETLSLGILGKLALWRALERAAKSDARLQGRDFAELACRAQAQFNRVEERRLQMADKIFQK